MITQRDSKRTSADSLITDFISTAEVTKNFVVTCFMVSEIGPNDGISCGLYLFLV